MCAQVLALEAKGEPTAIEIWTSLVTEPKVKEAEATPADTEGGGDEEKKEADGEGNGDDDAPAEGAEGKAAEDPGAATKSVIFEK
jgi:hypothetical protein